MGVQLRQKFKSLQLKGCRSIKSQSGFGNIGRIKKNKNFLQKRKTMGFIYSVLNIIIPVCLLNFQSLTRFRLSQEIPFGKWAMMIVAIYVFNWISWIFNESYIVFFADLLTKLGISFIPDQYNEKVENIVSSLHLQIWLDQLRCWIISGFHKYYWKVTEYLLSKMENYESKQFREGLLIKLNEDNTQDHDHQFVFKPVKHFVNAGINCDKLSEEIAQNISSTAKKLEEFSRKIVQEKNLHNQTFGQIKPTKEHEQKVQIKRQSTRRPELKREELPKFHYKKKQSSEKVALKQLPDLNLHLRASQQQLDLSDNDEEYVKRPQIISPINKEKQRKVQSHVVFKTLPKKIQQNVAKKQLNSYMSKGAQPSASQFKRTYTFTDYTSSEISSHPQNVMKPYREDGDPFSEELINKLDLSSSEYSDMFDQEDDEDLKILQCKVEVILEIGSGPSARLEIYNLELYSNRDLKIVSLYQREFESHKLKAMRPLPNNYYELVFDEGKISSRKCKFRGQNQPFMKYLQK